jgi:hypothetical protein
MEFGTVVEIDLDRHRRRGVRGQLVCAIDRLRAGHEQDDPDENSQGGGV